MDPMMISGSHTPIPSYLHNLIPSTPQYQPKRNNFKFSNIISRRALDIDSDAFIEVVIENKLDGRIFDRKNRKTFKNQGVFTKMFVSIPDYKGNPLRSLYGTMKKWKYVEMKEVKLVVKASEEEQDAWIK